MPRTPPQRTGTEQMTEDVKALAAQISQLHRTVEKLTDTVQILSKVLDELRDDFASTLEHRAPVPRVPGSPPLTSMPRDPLAEDFGERINRFSAHDLPPELRGAPTDAKSQPSLF